MNLIKVFEHEKVFVGNNNGCISRTQFDLLCQFNEKNESKYFAIGNKCIKFKQYVGVIQMGNVTIEILPKADKNTLSSNRENEELKWQKLLLSMLKTSGILKVDSISEAKLKKRHNSLLNLYFEIYLNELDSLLHQGLVKKYRKQSGNVSALKGQLQFSKNIQQNLIHQERFYTTHQTYDYRHTLHQILLKALRILKAINTNALLNDKINRVLFTFPEIEEKNITESTFTQVLLNRKTDKYREALKIAKMLILNYSPDISKGQENMLALLFDMNQLWEKYIFKMLKKGEAESDYTVSYQNSKDFWNSRTIRPDIVLKKGGETFIIDTKWKIIQNNYPSDADLKQMYVYNKYWGAQKSMLLYPEVQGNLDGQYGKYHEDESLCKVGFVSVFKDSTSTELNDGIGLQIFEQLEINSETPST